MPRSRGGRIGQAALASALGLWAAVSWTAEPAPKVLDEVIVSARGTETLISRTPGGIGLVAAPDIFVEQPISLSDALVRIPGISLSADAPWGGDVVIRGLGRNRVVFLVDHARVNTATDINAQYGLVNPYDIERIEVLKGPISALYGSGSVGGVVNVITRDARFTSEPEVHGTLANAVGTNPDGFSTYASAAYSDSRAKLFISGSRRNFQNYTDADWDPVHSSQFEDWHVTLKGGLQWDDVHTTAFQHRVNEGKDIGIPGQGLSLPAAARTVTYPRTGMRLAMLTHTITPADGACTESEVMLFRQVIERRARIEDFPPASPILRVAPDAEHETWGARWRNVFETEDHTMTVGLDAWEWSYTGNRVRRLRNGTVLRDMPLADSSQYSAGVFGEDSWRLAEDLTLSLGARVDRIVAESDAIPGLRPADSYHDMSWNGHAGLTWQAAPRWSLTFIGASSYRAPDLLDRFKVIDLGGGRAQFGNPDLDPERSLFAEGGLHYTGERVRASLSAFINRVDDLIIPMPTSPVREDMQNVNEATLHGLEAEAEWHVSRHCRLYAGIAWIEGENRTDDQYLRFTPPLNGTAGVRVDVGNGLWAAIETEWAARQDHTPPGTATADAWGVVNLRCGYTFVTGRISHDLLLSVDNVLNRDYSNYLATARGLDLKEPGIGATAAWRLGF